jgi:hypothetical protein
MDLKWIVAGGVIALFIVSTLLANIHRQIRRIADTLEREFPEPEDDEESDLDYWRCGSQFRRALCSSGARCNSRRREELPRWSHWREGGHSCLLSLPARGPGRSEPWCPNPDSASQLPTQCWDSRPNRAGS